MKVQLYSYLKCLLVSTSKYEKVFQSMGFELVDAIDEEKYSCWIVIGDRNFGQKTLFKFAIEKYRLPDKFVCAPDTLLCYKNDSIKSQIHLYFKLFNFSFDIRNDDVSDFDILLSESKMVTIDGYDLFRILHMPEHDRRGDWFAIKFNLNDEIWTLDNHFYIACKVTREASIVNASFFAEGSYSYIFTEFQLNFLSERFMSNRMPRLAGILQLNAYLRTREKVSLKSNRSFNFSGHDKKQIVYPSDEVLMKLDRLSLDKSDSQIFSSSNEKEKTTKS